MTLQNRKQKCKGCQDGEIYQYLWPIPPSLCAGEKHRFQENAFQEQWAMSFCLGDNDKNLGRVLLGVGVKIKKFIFFTHECLCQ